MTGTSLDPYSAGQGQPPFEHRTLMQHTARLVRESMAVPLRDAALFASESSGIESTLRLYRQPQWVIGEVEDCPAMGG